MIIAYSQRVLPPFSGVVQIAESEKVRAQSFDGVNWELHYLAANNGSNPLEKRVKGYALDRSYFKIAKYDNQQLTPFLLPAYLDEADVNARLEEMAEFLSSVQIPFPAADIYECWLLDPNDESPLALLFSCCDESLKRTFPSRHEWTALPHSKMRVENTDEEDERSFAPVNQRLQNLVARRAGYNPKVAWFNREEHHDHDFPCFLVREDWHHEDESDLCQRYLARKSPRLLMLHGLQSGDRERMEIAARQHVFEVEQYYPLYPEIHDPKRMSAIRVEARLRGKMPVDPSTNKKEKDSKIMPFSKDMRILE